MDTAEEVVDDILLHFGKKGMRWGVRNQVHPDIAHIPKKIRKEAAKDAEEFTRAKLFYGKGAGTRRKLIKAKVEARKVRDALYAKAFDHFVKNTDLGKRASQAKGQRKRKDVAGALKRPAKAAVRIAFNTLEQSDDRDSITQNAIDDILAEDGDVLLHFGRKGMRWGVRQDRSSKVTVIDRGKKLKTTGGYGRRAHPDAVRVRRVGQIGKKSGLKSLSDKDLQDYKKRLDLEASVHRLNFAEKNPARRFVGKLLHQTGSQVVNETAKTYASTKVKKVMLRGVKTAAVAAA